MNKEVDGFGSGGGGGAKKKRWKRKDTPRRQWTLQERSELVEKMGANRCRKMKGGWAAAEAAAVTS